MDDQRLAAFPALNQSTRVCDCLRCKAVLLSPKEAALRTDSHPYLPRGGLPPLAFSRVGDRFACRRCARS